MIDSKLELSNKVRENTSYLITPIYKIAEIPVEIYSNIKIRIESKNSLIKKNESLEKKVFIQSGIIQKIPSLKEENKRLKKNIDEYIYNSEELVAKVLIDKDSPFLKSIIVNKGSKDKVKLGMAVLDRTYLVGKIVEVNYSSARVLLVSDLNSKIPVGIEPGNIQSIMTGTGKQKGKIEYLEKEITIDDQSIVYTSGSGGLFKSGIPVGIYNKEENEEGKVTFFSKLTQLTFVKLVSFEEYN